MIMKVKKIFKFVLLILIIVFMVVIVKLNVTATKEESPNESQSYSVLNLDINSEIVTKLYESLNLELINNECKDNSCLVDENYNYLYFIDTLEKKTVSFDEKLYLTFNSLYKNENYNLKETESSESTESTNNNDSTVTLIFDEEKVKSEMETMFGPSDYESESNDTFKKSKDCGIVDYIYTGKSYELTIQKCSEENNKNSVGKTSLISAYKDGDYIHLLLKSFYAVTEKDNADDNENIYTVKNFNSDTSITTVSKNTLENESDKIFSDYPIDTYDITFVLVGTNYYLDSMINFKLKA